ncbi:hypothetical protein WH47_11560 [Habropoda laboriosa]|uniref:Uncharacterized protein n=1 Tax=Habropoda laboriosa TaxID=597456 RepID=A0A0L7QM25_9HYME|nr:hypothetical protein WH47_11560 [Habropoda laboriosa]
MLDRKMAEGVDFGASNRLYGKGKLENDTKSTIISLTVIWAVYFGAVISSTRVGTLFLTFFYLFPFTFA